MRIVAAIGGGVLILFILLDGFETVMLPRRVARKLRVAMLVFGSLWRFWVRLAGRLESARRREHILGLCAVLSLILLLGVWASTLGPSDEEPAGR